LKVLVTGAGGLVGRAVSAYCSSIGDKVLAYERQTLDISDRNQVMRTISRDRPEALINCGAWTDVDGCEINLERAFAVNAGGPLNLALACSELQIRLITISTDYVFDGEKQGFYSQRDQPNPQCVYGASKLEGEHSAQLAHARTVIVRTGFIFGPGGTNFLSTVVERARRGEKLKPINDSYGTPTYARDLATRLRELAKLDLPGIYHVVNAGEGASYELFARTALDLAGFSLTALEGVAMSSLHRPAPRPRNSRLRCLLSEAIGLTPLPFWKDSLRHFVALDSDRELVAKS
jgi:dTDP-4-dehydrorhamnose reductase